MKLQYQLVAQKLAMVKVKKAIKRQQEELGKEADRGGDAEQLRRQIGTLQQTLDIGEWREEDRPFVTDQGQKLMGHKRKLDERNDANLLARVRQLETNMEVEVQRRLAVEKAKLEQEKLQLRMRFEAQAQQLQSMMQSVSETTAHLQQVKKGPATKVKRRRVTSPQPTTSTAAGDNDGDGAEYIPISDVEPD